MAINDKVIEVNKFGVGSLQTDLTDIWSGADGTGSQIIAKPLPLNTGELLYVSSTSANDVDQGTGAWKIILSGQDAQGLLQQEEIILNGQTQVETTKRYRRVCRAWVSAAASDTGQDGKIYIGRQGATGGVPDTPEDNVFAIIADEVLTGQDFSANQTQMACYTVPVGYEAKMYEIRCASEASGADIIFYIRTKDSYDDNAVWRVRENIYTGSTGVGRRTYAVNARFPEGTDIQISGSASTNDQEASASFDLIVERVRDVAANMAGDLTVSATATYRLSEGFIGLELYGKSGVVIDVGGQSNISVSVGGKSHVEISLTTDSRIEEYIDENSKIIVEVDDRSIIT
jgi:hypothetical protein